MESANTVIQFEGPLDQPVWMSPIEEFGRSTQLLVDEAHEALVLIDGRVKRFNWGLYALKDETSFDFDAVQGLDADKNALCPCRAYFVDKVRATNMRWGTQEAVLVDDPELGMPLHLKIHGSLSYLVDSPIRFIERFTGFMDDFSLEEAVKVLREITSTEVSSLVAREIAETQVGFPTISNDLPNLSQKLKNALPGACNLLGIRLVSFDVESITTREDLPTEPEAETPAEPQLQEEVSPVPELSKPLTKDEFIDRVAELKELLELGIIDQSDFDQGKKDLLYRFTHN